VNPPPPIIVAHRGLHRAHPENSLAAFELAINDGFWVECDVHASRDGIPVVIHDETLERTTQASGRVDALDARDLERVRLRGSDQTVPTLERALSGGGSWLVEVKPLAARDLVRHVVDLLVRDKSVRWIVQSFDADNVRQLWAYHPMAAGALLVEDPRVLERAIDQRWPAVHLSHELLTSDARDRLRGAGSSVGVWTVNDPPDVRRVLELGVEMIITDEPERARTATEELRSGT
jgi:glycerophosphoryl diester phosphodiesterase